MSIRVVKVFLKVFIILVSFCNLEPKLKYNVLKWIQTSNFDNYHGSRYVLGKTSFLEK